MMINFLTVIAVVWFFVIGYGHARSGNIDAAGGYISCIGLVFLMYINHIRRWQGLREIEQLAAELKEAVDACNEEGTNSN